MTTFDIIVACCNKSGIGCSGDIPWHLKSDLEHFRKITTECPDNYRNVVIMGRKTWESLPSKYRPLPNRYNIVLTSNSIYLNEHMNKPNYKNNVRTYRSFKDAMEVLNSTKHLYRYHKIFVIGGERVYKEAINSEYCNKIYLTKIYKNYECDRFFPNISKLNTNIPNGNNFALSDVSEMKCENGIHFRYMTYTNLMMLAKAMGPIPDNNWSHNLWINKEEQQYLDVLKNILNHGDKRQTRNAITYSIFGMRMEFDISTYLPILTSKRVYWKGVVEELLWFLRGSTNAKELDARGVKIWNGNTTREFLDSRGLHHYEVGDIGPTYGFGFRHFGAEYEGMNADYTGKGFDQIAYVLNELRNNPTNRRILINLWNPAAMDQMSLTPCACQYQFYVNDGKLSCQMYQRSADMFLGNPFNISSSSLLTYILAKYSGLKPDRLIICLGDAHIYEGHIEAVNKQLKRTTRPFPILKIEGVDGDELPEDLKDLKYEHFRLIGYEPHPSIKAKMVA